MESVLDAIRHLLLAILALGETVNPETKAAFARIDAAGNAAAVRIAAIQARLAATPSPDAEVLAALAAEEAFMTGLAADPSNPVPPAPPALPPPVSP